MLKRCFDFGLAFLLLVVTLPVTAVVVALVWRTLGNPVLFRQPRPGKAGKPFTLYKFRTMSDQRGADGRLLSDDLRLHGVGKLMRRLSLDELPQLVNVLKGEMSLVGPRPLLVEYLPLYTQEQSRRHEVLPGITGWAQVNGRNAISWDEKFKFDVWYVDHQSFMLDLKILWLTFFRVVRSDGISESGSPTMSKFTGSHDAS